MMSSPAADLPLEAQDEHARALALDPRRSIILQAPAGSGKTTVLTQRFLRLLADVDEPEEILAMTFTRKAAAEMRSRVLDALAGRHENGTASLARRARERASARGWDLAAHPGRLRIQTIDALNRALAAQLPVAARAAIGLTVADRPEGLYRSAARRTLIDADAEPGARDDLERVLERLDNDPVRVERLLTSMLGVRAHWLPLLLRESPEDLPARVVASLASITADRLRAAQALLGRSLIERGLAILHACAGVPRRRPRAESASPPSLEDWRDLARVALTERREWRRVLTMREGFPPEETALKADALEWIGALARLTGARELLSELAGLPDAAFGIDEEATLRSLARLLRLAASELEIVFSESGRVDHAYVAAAARRALTDAGEPTDLSLRLGQHLRHILVDEFQDTSSGQVELLRALTAGWQPGDGRSLFLVGDPMQSIYLFREAEVGLFLKVAEQGLGELVLEPLTLTRNFRASGEIVHWLNHSLAQIFPARPDMRTSAVRYSPCVPGRSERHGRVAIHRIDAGDIQGETRAALEIVRCVRAQRPDSSIAVLVAARPHATAIAGALRAAGIAVAGVDLLPLAQVPVVRDLAALARALDHLADRTAWLAVLRAPWCGLSLRELTALLDGAGDATLWDALNDPGRVRHLPAGAQQRLTRVRGALGPALSARGTQPAAKVLEEAWLRLGGPAACASIAELAQAERLFERLAAWSEEPDWRGADGLTERLGTLFASDAASSRTAVQVMTIHRAKGLEFDVVLIPGLARTRRGDTEPLLRWLELPGSGETMDFLVAPITPRGADAAEPLNAYLKALQARRAANERTRLLYVAATRARYELHLLCELPPAGPSGKPPQPRAGTLLASLWPAIVRDLPPAAPAPVAPPARTEASSRALQRLPADWRPPQFAEPARQGPFVVEAEAATLPDFTWATHAARWAGRIVHERLRELGGRNVAPTRADILAAREAIAQRLRQVGLSDSERRHVQARAIDALLACVTHPRGQWLFSPEHRQAATPLELTGVLDGRLVSVAVDRSFVDADGTRWLVDIKVGVHGGEGVEDFLTAELERYRPQLERAAALAAGLGPEPVRAALFFPLLQEFRELLPAP